MFEGVGNSNKGEVVVKKIWCFSLNWLINVIELENFLVSGVDNKLSTSHWTTFFTCIIKKLSSLVAFVNISFELSVKPLILFVNLILLSLMTSMIVVLLYHFTFHLLFLLSRLTTLPSCKIDNELKSKASIIPMKASLTNTSRFIHLNWPFSLRDHIHISFEEFSIVLHITTIGNAKERGWIFSFITMPRTPSVNLSFHLENATW